MLKEKGKIKLGVQNLHLSSDSPLISKHHSNWRLKAIQSLERTHEDLLHYSSVMTCSNEDAQKIRSIMLRAVDEIRAIVRQSVGKSIFCYNLDLFEL